jgi:hypothetical protein
MKLTRKETEVFREGWEWCEDLCQYATGLEDRVNKLVRLDSQIRPSIATSRMLVMRRLVQWLTGPSGITLDYQNISPSFADFAALTIWLESNAHRLSEALPRMQAAVEVWTDSVNRAMSDV